MTSYIAITGAGLVTAVGNDSISSCAAIRCTLDNIQETPFTDQAGEPISACLSDIDTSVQGQERLVQLATAALQQCLDADPSIVCAHTPLILCLPERGRPGRPIDDEDDFFAAVQNVLGCSFSAQSRILTHGHVAAAVALRHARQLLDGTNPSIEHVLIASADSLIDASCLADLEDKGRLLTSSHSDGFIPGEAGAALVIKRTGDNPHAIQCLGLGFSMEPAPILSDKPCRAEGLTLAIRSALQEAQIPMQDMAYRITDLTGEHYYFREAAVALSRKLRVLRDDFDLLHPAECVGNTGASLGLIILAYQRTLFLVQPPNLPQVLVHLGDDDGKRAAIVLGIS